jgi:hypothetical protein
VSISVWAITWKPRVGTIESGVYDHKAVSAEPQRHSRQPREKTIARQPHGRLFADLDHRGVMSRPVTSGPRSTPIALVALGQLRAVPALIESGELPAEADQVAFAT